VSSINTIFVIMKKLTLLLSSCFAVIAMFNSCSNDFDLVDTWKDIPVVYGLLNANDSIQYIKIEKAFLDETTSALIVAQEPDSLYYSDISVKLEEQNSNGAVQREIPLDLVDANNEGFPKEEGIFATTPNYVFKTVEPLNEERRYNIVINTGGDSGKTITLEEKNGQRSIGLIGDIAVLKPTLNNPYLFEVGRKADFKWRLIDGSGEPNAAFYDVVMFIHYTERQQGNAPVNKVLEWTLSKNRSANDDNAIQTLEVEGVAFYQYMSQQLDPVGLDVCRELQGFDFAIYAGGEDLYEYINRQAANTGITGTQPLVDYTNLSEGIGILSTRYDKRLNGLSFRANVIDELIVNDLTRDLGFRDSGDCN